MSTSTDPACTDLNSICTSECRIKVIEAK
jgi:hypothetical protein